MKNIKLIFVFVGISILYGCPSSKENKSALTDENIFREIFFLEKRSNSTIPELEKIRFNAGIDKLKPESLAKITKLQDSIIQKIYKTQPTFFAEFGKNISSGNPLLIKEYLSKGASIVLKTININENTLKRNTVNSFNKNLKESEKKQILATIKQDNIDSVFSLVQKIRSSKIIKRPKPSSTDIAISLPILPLPPTNDSIIIFKSGLGIDASFEPPIPDIQVNWQSLPDGFPSVAFAENIIGVLDVVIVAEVAIAVVAIIGIPLSETENSFLTEKLVRNIAIKYKK